MTDIILALLVLGTLFVSYVEYRVWKAEHELRLLKYEVEMLRAWQRKASK
jgi:hypothetical protein